MNDRVEIDELTPGERALLDWIEAQADGAGLAAELPPELLQQVQRLPQLLHCLRQLEALAIPAPALQGSADSPESLLRGGGPWPRTFGPYDLEAELGRGGMGVVYLARHRTLNTYVALKVIRRSEFASPGEIRRFFREAQAASRMKHPHVVHVHDAGEIDGLPYLVMQYISGETLAQRLRRGVPGREGAVTLLATVARAVHYLHEQGIVHRDLKPGNILIDHSGHAYVTDFGLVKLFDTDLERTATGAVIGTPAYMAPEQAWGRPDDVTAASDLYSLGAILYELLTGQVPFPEQNPLDQILRLRDSEPRPPRQIDRHIPMELQQICLCCLEKRPGRRYGSAAELAADLERFVRGEPIALRPVGLWNGLRRWLRRQPALACHLCGLATMALIVQAADLFAAGHRQAYGPVMLMLAIWTLCSIILQKLLSRNVPGIKLVWVGVDAVLFTLAVAFAEGPVESLVVGYSLLIVASGLWYEESNVLLMTAASVLAYLALLQVRGAPQPAHYPFIVVGILLVVGGVITAMVRRIRRLLHQQTAWIADADHSASPV